MEYLKFVDSVAFRQSAAKLQIPPVANKRGSVVWLEAEATIAPDYSGDKRDPKCPTYLARLPLAGRWYR